YRRRRTGHLRHGRCRRRAPPPRKGPRRGTERTDVDQCQTRQRRVSGQGARHRRRQDPRPPATGPRRSRSDHEPPGRAVNDTPTPDAIASLLQVEHLLEQRWPETRIEPSLTRISALMELLGSPQRGYPSIHIAGTNGKTSVARMVD